MTDSPVASSADCVRIARAVGLSMAEIQRASGLARQTAYRQLPTQDTEPRAPEWVQAQIEVLMLIAAEREYAAPTLLARRGTLDDRVVARVVEHLAATELCATRDAGYGVETAANEATYDTLREHFDDLYLRRPDAITIYIMVRDDQRDAIAQSATAVMSHDSHLLNASVAPSLMLGPELAFHVNAPTVRRALDTARDVWHEILEHAGLLPTEPRIANVIPAGAQPTAASEVLDSFLEAMIDTGIEDPMALIAVRGRYPGGSSEIELASRCLTLAVLSLRRAVGNQSEPRPITDGDVAWMELSPARALHLDASREAVQTPVVAALRLATDRLGPIPGGRLGSFPAADQPPAIVHPIFATASDRAQMAQLSGQAVGAAVALGLVDGAGALDRAVTGSNNEL